MILTPGNSEYSLEHEPRTESLSGEQRRKKPAYMLDFLQDVWTSRQKKDAKARMLTYIVTFRCNARCVMCDSWKKDGKGDMNLEDIESVFRKLPAMDAVRLSGGEPFVRNDFAEIVAMAQYILKPSMMQITSNGFLTERIIQTLEDRDKDIPLWMLISIDGMKERHNQIRGIPTAFNKASETLRQLAPRQKELNIRLAVNQTIVDNQSMSQYRELHQWLKDLGVQHNVVFAYEESATYSTEQEKEVSNAAAGNFQSFGNLSEDQVDSFLRILQDDLQEMSTTDKIAKRYYYKGMRNRLLRGKNSPNPPCVALSTHLRLFPNGDVPTCQFNSRKAGNLLHQSYDEFLESEQRNTQRDWVRKCKGCWAECEVVPNAVFTGDILTGGLF